MSVTSRIVDPDLFLGPHPTGSGVRALQFEETAQASSVRAMSVRGRRSDLVSEETARHFLKLQPAARFVDVFGAGHMVADDRTNAFTDAIAHVPDSLD